MSEPWCCWPPECTRAGLAGVAAAAGGARAIDDAIAPADVVMLARIARHVKSRRVHSRRRRTDQLPTLYMTVALVRSEFSRASRRRASSSATSTDAFRFAKASASAVGEASSLRGCSQIATCRSRYLAVALPGTTAAAIGEAPSRGQPSDCRRFRRPPQRPGTTRRLLSGRLPQIIKRDTELARTKCLDIKRYCDELSRRANYTEAGLVSISLAT